MERVSEDRLIIPTYRKDGLATLTCVDTRDVDLENDDIEPLIVLKELKDKIILTGFVPDEDLPALYTEAELFIYPSLFEGFGLPVLEAMQCGTPVLTCDNTSLPEVGGDAVEYISGKDISETVQKMAELHQNSNKLKQMSSAGLKRAQQFSWVETVNKIFNLK